MLNTRFFALLLSACALFHVAGVHAQAGRNAPADVVEVDRIVAVVNSDAITLYELRARTDQAMAQLRGRNVTPPPREDFERQVLERMIYEKVQLQHAEETQMRVDDRMLEAALGRIAESNNMNATQLRSAVERDGISWSSFRDDIRKEIILSRLRDREVESRVVVTEGEIDNYLASPQRKAEQPEEYNISHILLRVPEGASPETLLRLKARADAALDAIRRGEDFARVAASYSEAQDALSGGSLGWRPVDRMPQLFADMLPKLKVGEVSDVMRSPAGFHIMKVVDKRGGVGGGDGRVSQTRARHILIKTSEVMSDAEARRRLTSLKERLDNGGSFEELARSNSQDLSAAKGGDLGWLYPGDTVPEFEKVMNALQPGQVSEPVQSPFGWHLIQVVERRVEDVSTERQRAAARMALRERKAEEVYQDWVRQLRDRAYVEIRLNDER
ncbi:MAG: molecular chaperone SurA [Methyloversatilis sp.]|jgi:peptidyl-prolyl cis-trans isomerase SurA|uniref:Chaperone SurA n=1 Tax=Methyloversatilis universalis (strain ATCC BAA-1314 / DSM 25237 / JCM 13912 / CCUG 52030 / FAM5) TaxID=1000565 RepID=F5RHS1_METUF|nr:peptidylprolyl isomerase [Methyloversatilis universalis]EGK69903.1 Chaperone SurA precursor [Methyloversatilis universalis FAM5]MCP4636544.1 molecular chaperone SurA [Methyloversatilis sp.]